MGLIQKASKLGYKHYTEFTIEELDKLTLENLNKQIEYYFIQKWLREKHGIVIILIATLKHYYIGEIWQTISNNPVLSKTLDDSKTYEETLEKGLQEALKLIRNGKI